MREYKSKPGGGAGTHLINNIFLFCEKKHGKKIAI
jgi:hypothetical protein